MRKITFVIFLTIFFCVLGAESDLERAMKESCVSEIRRLLRSGAELTQYACELAGKREDALAHYIFLYVKDVLDTYLNGGVVVGISRAQAYTCLSALLMHVQDVALVRKLLLCGARIDYKDNKGNTALSYALADEKQIEKARIIANERENIYDQLLMHVQQKTLTKEFLKQYFTGLNRLSINRAYQQLEWRTVLMGAVIDNYYAGVQLLLKYGAVGVNEALLLALHRSNKYMIKLLIGHGAYLRRMPGALSLVVNANQQAAEITRWLAPLVCKREQNRALIQACLKGDLELVRILVHAGASLYYRDERGITPLYAAVLGHNLAVVKTLAAHKNVKLTQKQLDFTKTFFPKCYDFLTSTSTKE